MAGTTFNKALAAAAAAVGTTFAVFADGHLDGGEASALVLAWGAVVAVFAIRNAVA